MKMKRVPLFKSLLIALVTLTTTINTSFAAGGAAFEAIFTKSSKALKSALQKEAGFDSAAAEQAVGFVEISLRALGVDKQPTPNQLKRVIGKLGGNATDIKYRDQLLKIVNANKKTLEGDDLKEAINALLYLAGRFTKNGAVVHACAKCVAGALVDGGIRFALKEFKSGNVFNILEGFNNMSSKEIIAQANTSLAAKGYPSSPTPTGVSPQHEKAFALNAYLLANGTPQQQKYSETALKTLLVNGRLDFSSNKFWMRHVTEMGNDEMIGVNELMEAAIKRAEDEGIDVEDAFYAVLRSRSNGKKAKEIEALQKNECFFSKR